MRRVVFFYRRAINIMSSSSVISIINIDTHVLSARSRIISLCSTRSSENNRWVEKNHEIEKNRRDETEMRMRSREKDHDSRFSTRWDESSSFFFYTLIDEMSLRNLDSLKRNDWLDMLRDHFDLTYTRVILDIIQCDVKIEYIDSF
jgi:hypothetical protein